MLHNHRVPVEVKSARSWYQAQPVQILWVEWTLDATLLAITVLLRKGIKDHAFMVRHGTTHPRCEVTLFGALKTGSRKQRT